MEPVITYRKNENFGITNIFYGHLTSDLHTVEDKIRTHLLSLSKEQNYIEIDIINLDYSIDAFVFVHYSYIKN